MSPQAAEADRTETFIPIRFSVSQTVLLSPEISRYDERAIDVYRDGTPLIELAHGFWGKSDGEYVSPEIRNNIHDTRGRGEWTYDFIDFDAETPAGVVVPRGYARANWIREPENIEERKGTYHAEGGTIIPVELPRSGWRVPDSERSIFHPLTGWALETLPRDKKDEAARRLKYAGYKEEDLSYSRRPDNGLRAVLRLHFLPDGGPFCVLAACGPVNRYSGIGARSRRRLEPLRSKGDARGTVVAVSPEEYERFMRLEKFYEGVAGKVSSLRLSDDER